jgi:hypothetical protein
MMMRMNLRYVVSMYGNIIMKPPEQLLYANENIKNVETSLWDRFYF